MMSMVCVHTNSCMRSERTTALLIKVRLKKKKKKFVLQFYIVRCWWDMGSRSVWEKCFYLCAFLLRAVTPNDSLSLCLCFCPLHRYEVADENNSYSFLLCVSWCIWKIYQIIINYWESATLSKVDGQRAHTSTVCRTNRQTANVYMMANYIIDLTIHFQSWHGESVKMEITRVPGVCSRR